MNSWWSDTITYGNANVGCSSPVTQLLGQIVGVTQMQTLILEDLYSWVLIKVCRKKLPVCGILVYELDWFKTYRALAPAKVMRKNLQVHTYRVYLQDIPTNVLYPLTIVSWMSTLARRLPHSTEELPPRSVAKIPGNVFDACVYVQLFVADTRSFDNQ